MRAFSEGREQTEADRDIAWHTGPTAERGGLGPAPELAGWL